MAITAIMSATVYAQTALLFIAYNVNDVSTNFNLDIRVQRPDIWTQGAKPAIQRYNITLTNTGDGTVTVPIYPLPENTAVTIQLYQRISWTYTYITAITINTGRISTSAKYEEIPVVNSSSASGFPDLLSENDKKANARIFFNRLYNDVWSDSAIASILAFAEHYGGINPNINLKYLMPWALYYKPYSPWQYYFHGDTYETPNQGQTLQNYQQFGTYTGRSGDNNEFITPELYTQTSYRGGAKNAFLQRPININAIPRQDDTNKISGCMTFLPVYKQHYIDILDTYSPTKWYETTAAFTIEQYLDYLIFYKNNQEAALDLFTAQSPLANFTMFTLSTAEPEVLVLQLYDSLLAYSFNTGNYLGYVCEWGKDIMNARIILPRLCRKWYDYIKTLPHVKPGGKRKGMPIWEYLGYTI